MRHPFRLCLVSALALAASLTLIAGQARAENVQQGTTPWAVLAQPSASGGLTRFTGSVGATATALKASAGQLYSLVLANPNASAVWVQLFNKATGSVTLGTTAPDWSVMVPAGGVVVWNNDLGLAFGTAISFACTTTRAGATGPAATCDVNAGYD